MNQTTDEEENALVLKFGNVNFRQIQSLTNDVMYVVCQQRKQDATTRSEYGQFFF